MRRPFLQGCVVALGALAAALAACESPRDTGPISPEGDGGGEDGVVRGGSPAGAADGGSEMDAAKPADVVVDTAADTDTDTDTDAGLPPSSCTPGARRCGPGHVPELCSAVGRWALQAACPFVCSGNGQCTGECTPGQTSCAGAAMLLCRADATYASQPCPAMPDSTVSCSSGRCAYQAMCDLGRRSWTMTSTSRCANSIWTFIRRSDGHWDAREAGCGNATGIASYDGTTIRLDFVFDIGRGQYVWPVDSRCVGTKGTLTFTAGSETGNSYDSTLMAN